jgi:hypothetical protein
VRMVSIGFRLLEMKACHKSTSWIYVNYRLVPNWIASGR